MSKIGFPREKSCKKIHDFLFCPNMQSFLIFSSKITTATFFGELPWAKFASSGLILPFFSSIWGENATTHFHLGRKCHCIISCESMCWFTFQLLERTVIHLPENWENRHLFTRKLGKPSSSYPKKGENVIRLPEKREKRHPIDLCQYVCKSLFLK